MQPHPSMGMNPIISGFAPDPSVVFVQGTYFLVTSSFHLFPGIPIYASKDLVAWEHIGNAINRPSQLLLGQSSTRLKPPDDGKEQLLLATGGLYAPTIRYKDGITYIICTNFIHDGPERFRLENFIVSTKDIWSHTWSDPVYFDYHGIDPSLFWDDDGRVYVQGSAWGDRTRVSCLEIDLATGAILTPEKDIWDGFTKVIPEGPHIYKRDSYYYLLVSEGGTSEDHCLVMARSKSIWGPYESCPQNPILKPADDSLPIQHTGHGDFFTDERGQWWMVCLGVRKSESRYHMGRESFLARVQWPSGLWPVIEPIEINPAFQETLLEVRTTSAHMPTANPLVDLVYIRDPNLQSFRIAPNGQDFDIFPSKADLRDPERSISFIGRRQRCTQGHASVRLLRQTEDCIHSSRAGLVIYKDEHRFARCYWDSDAVAVVFEVLNVAKSISITSAFPMTPPKTVLTFGLSYSSNFVQFKIQVDNEAEVYVGTIDTLDLTGYDFVGPVIGVFSTSQRGSSTVDRFRDFVLDQHSVD